MPEILLKVSDIIEHYNDGDYIESVSSFHVYVANVNFSKSVLVTPAKKFILVSIQPENKEEQISWVNYKKTKKTEVTFNTLVFNLYDLESNCLYKHIVYFNNLDNVINFPYVKLI